MLYELIKPLLFQLDPEVAHRITMSALRTWRHVWPHSAEPWPGQAIEVAGVHFANCVGLAAGFDKNGDYIDVLGSFGFGHIELGTVTPRPQPGNDKPRLFRIPQAEALINRMGFNNRGVQHLVRRLQASKYAGIKGVNIGKNADTPLERAQDDYLTCFQHVYPYADYVVVNISSPNTVRLRELQADDGLKRIIEPLLEQRIALSQQYGNFVPLLVKVAPDLADTAIVRLAQTARVLPVEGLVATNTTVERAAVSSFPYGNESGGLSGRPLFSQALHTVQLLRQELGPDFPLIGVGGVMNGESAMAMLNAGANLVQVYSGFVYRGPNIIRDILDHVSQATMKHPQEEVQ